MRKNENKVETPEEYMKKQVKRTKYQKVSKSKEDRLRKKKEKAFDEMQEGLMKLKQEFLDTALFPKSNKKTMNRGGGPGGNVKVIRNLDVHSFVLESLRANMSATQTIFLLSKDFNLTIDSAKVYYWQSIKYLRSTIDDNTKEEMKYILTKQMESIQRLALTQGDLKSSIKAGEIVAKLGGLFEPEKVELNGDLTFALSFPTIDNTTDDEVTEDDKENDPDLNVNKM